jgi:hypothetical protein
VLCSGYIVVILPSLAFSFCYAYILYLVYYIESSDNDDDKVLFLGIQESNEIE